MYLKYSGKDIRVLVLTHSEGTFTLYKSLDEERTYFLRVIIDQECELQETVRLHYYDAEIIEEQTPAQLLDIVEEYRLALS